MQDAGYFSNTDWSSIYYIDGVIIVGKNVLRICDGKHQKDEWKPR